MTAQWTHPELGVFDFDDHSWVRTIEVPAFKAFSFDTGYSNAPRSNGMHELAFEADDESDHPTEIAIELAATVLENQNALVATVANALWEDFNGRGPASGMWWHGDLEEVFEYLDEDPPDGPEGIPPFCRFREYGSKSISTGTTDRSSNSLFTQRSKRNTVLVF